MGPIAGQVSCGADSALRRIAVLVDGVGHLMDSGAECGDVLYVLGRDLE